MKLSLYEKAFLEGTILAREPDISYIEFQTETGIYLAKLKVDLATKQVIGASADLNAELIEQVPKGGIMLDIGACVGRYSVCMAKKADTVYAFEPNPDACAIFVKNTAYYDNIKLLQVAVSNKAGTTKLNKTRNIGRPFVGQADGKSPYGVIDVPTVTVDDMFGGLNCPVTGIKIDVEGHELEVLEGAVGVLKAHKPLIALETHKGVNCVAIQKFLESLGYKNYRENGQITSIIEGTQFLCVVE